MELIFGAFSIIFILCLIIAISFVIFRFSIKFFEKRTNEIWLLNTQPPQMSVFTRIFLKLNYLVYYLYFMIICFIISCGFFKTSGAKIYNWDLLEKILGNIFKPILESLLRIFYGHFEPTFYILFCCSLFFLPSCIKALYYYKKTGFKFLRVYVVVAFVYYALWCFLVISQQVTLAYENFNPQVLKPLKEAFLGLF